GLTGAGHAAEEEMAPEGVPGEPEWRNSRAIPQNIAQLEPCLASILGGKGEIFIFYKRESAERFGRIGEQRKNFLVCCPDDCRSWGGTPLKPEARRLDSACHHR